MPTIHLPDRQQLIFMNKLDELVVQAVVLDALAESGYLPWLGLRSARWGAQ